MSERSEIIKTNVADVWVSEQGILYVKIFKDSEIGADDAMELFAVYEKLGCKNKKVLQILDATAGATITPEGRECSVKYSKDYLIASAVISNNLAVKIIVNFFNAFYKYEVPLKLFTTESEGLKWLSTFTK